MVSGSLDEEVVEKPGPSADVHCHGVLFYGGTGTGSDCPATSTRGRDLSCDATVPFKALNIGEPTLGVLLRADEK